MLFRFCPSVWYFFASTFGGMTGNMKELCICGDRKYCNVIQHNISYFKQRFRFQRQQTECTLDYNAAKDATTNSKENKMIWKFHVTSQIDVYRVCANKYPSKVLASRMNWISIFRLITNSWEIVEDGGWHEVVSSFLPCFEFEKIFSASSSDWF